MPGRIDTSLPAITATSYYKIVGVAALAFRLTSYYLSYCVEHWFVATTMSTIRVY